MKLVDMTDSKSVASDSVPVQVRPLVPNNVVIQRLRKKAEPLWFGFFFAF